METASRNYTLFHFWEGGSIVSRNSQNTWVTSVLWISAFCRHRNFFRSHQEENLKLHDLWTGFGSSCFQELWGENVGHKLWFIWRFNTGVPVLTLANVANMLANLYTNKRLRSFGGFLHNWWLINRMYSHQFDWNDEFTCVSFSCCNTVCSRLVTPEHTTDVDPTRCIRKYHQFSGEEEEEGGGGSRF